MMKSELNVMSKAYYSFLSMLDCAFEFVNTVKEFFVLGIKILIITLTAIVEVVLRKPEKDLKHETVLITGSAHGVGKQLAIEVAKQGAKVVLWDINKDGLAKVAEDIALDGGKAFSYVCDVTSETDVKSKAEAVIKEVGDVTILVNNAGIMQNVPILELDSEKIKRTFEVNTLSHFWTIRAFLPKMRENNYGQIVAISSCAGISGHVNQTDYSASKFAVNGLMSALAEEHRTTKSNVRLTTICPVTIDTGMNHHPVAKYRWIIPILSVEEAAQSALKAIKREETLVTIPCRTKYFLYFAKLFPPNVLGEIMNVLEYCQMSNSTMESGAEEVQIIK